MAGLVWSLNSDGPRVGGGGLGVEPRDAVWSGSFLHSPRPSATPQIQVSLLPRPHRGAVRGPREPPSPCRRQLSSPIRSVPVTFGGSGRHISLSSLVRNDVESNTLLSGRAGTLTGAAWLQSLRPFPTLCVYCKLWEPQEWSPDPQGHPRSTEHGSTQQGTRSARPHLPMAFEASDARSGAALSITDVYGLDGGTERWQADKGWAGLAPIRWPTTGETLRPPGLWFLRVSKCDFWQSWGSCEDRLAATGFSGLALLKSSTSRTSPGD